MDDYRARCEAYHRVLEPETPRGIYAYRNLSLGMATSIVGVQAGAIRTHASLAAMSADVGNAPQEVFVVAADPKDWKHRTDLSKFLQVDGRGTRACSPASGSSCVRSLKTVGLDYPGLCSRFLQHAERSSARYGVDTHQILRKLGLRRMLDSQEDMIADVTCELHNSHG